ncbi:hypothetical protein, partial [Staphylococcus aureus]|uniref:hypothetical protein n=1 Tax=Staphylococcus aureus TaxID=1280 RepID=UPI001643286A
KQNYNNREKVSEKKISEDVGSDIDKSVDKTVKRKEKGGRGWKEKKVSECKMVGKSGERT